MVAGVWLDNFTVLVKNSVDIVIDRQNDYRLGFYCDFMKVAWSHNGSPIYNHSTFIQIFPQNASPDEWQTTRNMNF